MAEQAYGGATEQECRAGRGEARQSRKAGDARVRRQRWRRAQSGAFCSSAWRCGALFLREVGTRVSYVSGCYRARLVSQMIARQVVPPAVLPLARAAQRRVSAADMRCPPRYFFFPSRHRRWRSFAAHACSSAAQVLPAFVPGRQACRRFPAPLSFLPPHSRLPRSSRLTARVRGHSCHPATIVAAFHVSVPVRFSHVTGALRL